MGKKIVLLLVLAILLTSCMCPEGSTWTAICEKNGKVWYMSGNDCSCGWCGWGAKRTSCSVYKPGASSPGLLPWQGD